MALTPFIIRWGPDTSSDRLRACARCGQCGHSGVMFAASGMGLARDRMVAVFAYSDLNGSGKTLALPLEDPAL
jgi:hypothetical protein